jgi:hypothetical protein
VAALWFSWFRKPGNPVWMRREKSGVASAAFAAELMSAARFQLAIEQDAPVPRGTLRADARRAVGRRGVVSARMRVKVIQGAM